MLGRLNAGEDIVPRRTAARQPLKERAVSMEIEKKAVLVRVVVVVDGARSDGRALDGAP